MDYRTLPLDTLKSYILELNRAYHDLDDPIVADSEYDHALRILNERLADAGEPVMSFVGAKGTAKGFEKSRHRVPTLSLDNVFSSDEMSNYVKGQIGKGVTRFIAEPKIDGLSLTLTYVDGTFVKGVTRGDGEVGEDVTANVKVMKDVPMAISMMGLVEVRGEAYMSKADFIDMNAELEASGKKLKANPRNAAAGTLRQHDVEEVRKRGLSFIAYNLESDRPLPYTRDSECMEALKSMGFEAIEYRCIADPARLMEQAEDVFQYHNEVRSSRGYDVDGIVFKVDDLPLRREIGETSRFPLWGIAWKFDAEKAPTHLLSVTYQVGRTGAVTPVANLQPVGVGGVIVQRATLHGYENFMKTRPHVGARVIIQRAGDVVPEIVSMEGGDAPVEFPNTCPSCGRPMTLRGASMFCTASQSEDCRERDIQFISYVASRDVLNINGVSTGTVTTLYDAGAIRRPHDLFILEEGCGPHEMRDKFYQVYTGRSREIIQQGITACRETPIDFWRFISALGIPLIAKSTPKEIARIAGTPSNLRNLLDTGYDFTPHIGAARASNLAEWYEDAGNKDYFLVMAAILTITPVEPVDGNGVLSGKTIVFTGSIEGYDRKRLEGIAEKMGAKASGSVSKKTDMVVFGDKAGSKYTKAVELGVPVMRIEEWLAEFAS